LNSRRKAAFGEKNKKADAPICLGFYPMCFGNFNDFLDEKWKDLAQEYARISRANVQNHRQYDPE
jgi:hypothetical protein